MSDRDGLFTHASTNLFVEHFEKKMKEIAKLAKLLNKSQNILEWRK